MPTISRYDRTPRLCRITCYDDLAFLFLSGDTAEGMAPNHVRQAGEVFARLDAMLERAGSHRSMILSATLWVDGVALCGPVERLFREWAGAEALSTLTIGAGRLVSPGKLIEVGLVCRRNKSDKETQLPAIERLVTTQRISRIVKYGDLIFLAGVTAPEPDPDPHQRRAYRGLKVPFRGPGCATMRGYRLVGVVVPRPLDRPEVHRPDDAGCAVQPRERNAAFRQSSIQPHVALQ